ncbi:MAG: tetratricopeptide repeat protein, partial [Planctomycetes bacterium]|nr:tetratricopeptide repeat protein [Planctomycetota bacterium]
MPKFPWTKNEGSAGATAEAKRSNARKSTSASNDKLLSQAAFARLHERRGEVKQAEEMYRQLSLKDPDMVEPNHRLGVIKAKQGDFEAANACFQAALNSDPHNVELLVDAGYAFYLQNRFNEAEQLYKEAWDFEQFGDL